ncbi:MAG: helix-turn-helix domain-containing protein [Cellulomonadaceae bacterium]
MLRKIGVLLADGLTLFEFGVLCEVFGVDRTDDGVPPFDFRIVGVRPGVPVQTAAQVPLVPALGLDALEDVDLLAIPATAVRDQYDPAVLQAVRDAHARGTTLLSVCSGVFLLAAAGVVGTRTVTTHWRHAAELARAHPELTVDPNVLFVDEGDLVTSAGTAAGIDACLHLVRRELGSEVANAIARRMVVPPQRDGGQRQFIPQPVPLCTDDSLRGVLEWTAEHLSDPHTVESLAARALMSPRTFARRFAAETGSTPMRWLVGQRVLRAQHLLEETDLDVEAVAHACGFGSAALLRHHFGRVVGVAPLDYRTTFRCAEAS